MKNNNSITVGYLATRKKIEELGLELDNSKNFLYKTILRSDLNQDSPGVEKSTNGTDTSEVYEYVSNNDSRLQGGLSNLTEKPVQFIGTTVAPNEVIFTGRTIKQWAIKADIDATIEVVAYDDSVVSLELKADIGIKFNSAIKGLTVVTDAVTYEIIGEEVI